MLDAILAYLPGVPLLLSSLLLLTSALYLIYSYCYQPFQLFKRLGVPGPKPQPIIGNLSLWKQFDADISKIDEHLVKTYGRVSGVYLGRKAVYCIADLDLLKLILVKHFDKFVNRFGDTGLIAVEVDGRKENPLITALGDNWRRRRHIMTPAFSTHKMRLMEPLIKQSTETLAFKVGEAADQQQALDMIGMYNKFTMEVILAIAFGRSLEVQNGKGGKLYEAATFVFTAFSSQADTNMKMMQPMFAAFPFLITLMKPLIKRSEFWKCNIYLTKVAAEIARSRRDNAGETKRKDLLQLMMDATDEETKEGLTNSEVVADAVGLLTAGYETTSMTLTAATYLLALHTDVQEKLANEIHDYFEENPDRSMYDASNELQYLDMVIEETLRLYPPVSNTMRICTESCVLNGVTFVEGVKISIPVRTLHYDPSLWDEPNSFNPNRFTPEEKAKRHPCAYMPFGYGPRNCIGMRFALLEVKMALIEIVSKFRMALSPETKVPMETEYGLTLRPKTAVRVMFERVMQ